MSLILQVFCSLFSGVLLAYAIPNEYLLYGSPLCGLIALSPLYVAVTSSKSYKQTFCLCFIQAATCHLLSSFWLGNFEGFAAFTLGASLVGTGFILATISLFFSFPKLFSEKSSELQGFAGIRHFAIPFRIVWFTSVYTIYEWCKSTGFLAYPWGTVSMTAFKFPFITQIADITGTYGITFLFVLTSAFLGELYLQLQKNRFYFDKSFLTEPLKNTLSVIGILFFISSAYGTYQLAKERLPVKYVSSVLVQHNNDSWARNEHQNILISQSLTEEALNELSSADEKCDLVVWSEAILAKRFPNAENYYKYYPEEESLIKFIKRMKVPFIIGGPFTINAAKGDYGNSALLFDKNGKFQGNYIKMHLVPFAELIPGRQFEKVRKIVKKIAGSYGWAPGKKIVIFEIPLTSTQPEAEEEFKTVSLVNKKKSEQASVKFATPICFDDSAVEVCRAMFLCGSELFVNITNDSWSKTKSAEIQHFVVAHYRSIEFRTTTMRAANAGFTTVIDATGQILAELPLFEEGTLTFQVPVFKREMTIYARFGNWLPSILILMVLLVIIVTVKKQTGITEISTQLVPYSIEWYEMRDFIMSIYDKVYAIDWNNWNC